MKYGWGKEIAGLWRNLKVQGVNTGLEIQFSCTGSLMGNGFFREKSLRKHEYIIS